jgi:hypothetical protein
MAVKAGTEMLWYDTIGRTPIRIGIPVGLTLPEAKAALEEFSVFLAELAKFPNADKISIGEAHKIAIDLEKRGKP